MPSKDRLGRVQAQLEAHRLDAVLVTHLPNIRYLCGFTGSAGVLAVTDRAAIFFTDGRYTEQARAEVRGARISIRKGKSGMAAVIEWLAGRDSLRRIGIESAHMTVAERDVIRRSLRRACKIVNAPPIVEQMRMTKSPEEIAKIRTACELGARLFDGLVQKIRPGIPETEVAGQLEFAARKAGVNQMAFPTIIAGGKRSALPHGRASQDPIPRRGFVVCDFGVILSGYCSDMTRTLHVGRPAAEARRVYEAVRDAQQAGLEAVKPGKTVGDVDLAARKLLHKKGLEKFFTHSTGHGLGLEIHEAPRVAAGQEEVLRPGMVITAEPGVYLPGKWGVRIEDTVVVTETGCEILTKCSKELLAV
jgi:Xaa-Pro aminopeptidase